MNRERFRHLHRTARLGNLGTLTFEAGARYYWFLENVYDLRYPHLGSDRHAFWRTCDTLQTANIVRRTKWERQSRYAANIKFCPRCKGTHHQHHDCPR